MPGLDFGQILASALSGGTQGLAEQRQANVQNQLAAQKIQDERNKTLFEAGKEGFSPDASGALQPDQGFYTPGNPSFERAKAAAQFKLQSSPKFVADPPSLEMAYPMTHMGQPLPDSMQPFKDYKVPYEYASSLKMPGAAANPANQPATPGQIAAFESVNGKGTAGNLTAGAFNRNANAQLVGGMAAGRQQVQVGAEADRQEKQLEQQKALQTGRFSTGQKSMDSAFGKQYNDWVGGDRDAMMDTVAQLNDASNKLRAYKPPLGIGALGYAAQFTPGSELAEARNQAEAAISGDLKAKFGSRVSNLDLMTGLKFTYNPNLSPKQNADRLDNITQQLGSRIGARDAKGDFYGNNDSSLYGFSPQKRAPNSPIDKGKPAQGTPMRSSLYGNQDNEDVNTGQPVDPGAVRAAAKAKGGGAVGVNGNVIPGNVVNQIQAMPDKGTLQRPQQGAQRIVPDPDKPGAKMTLVFDGKRWNEK